MLFRSVFAIVEGWLKLISPNELNIRNKPGVSRSIFVLWLWKNSVLYLVDINETIYNIYNNNILRMSG